jgi:hypothetical protein
LTDVIILLRNEGRLRIFDAPPAARFAAPVIPA